MVGPIDDWAYSNNARRLAGALSSYDHAMSDSAPADVVVYFDPYLADECPVPARKSILRIGGPRPIDHLYGDDDDAMRGAFARFDAIVALNGELARRVANVHPNVHMIPNGLDLTRWSPSARLKRQRETFTIGYAASVKSPEQIESKGYATAKAAVAACQDVRLLSALKLKDRAQIPHGRMIEEFYSQIDLLIHPSVREGSSNVIMEAHALGVPVVTTRLAGLHGELFVDDRNALIRDRAETAFTEAIARAKQDESLRRRIAEGGRAFAERHHNLAVVAKGYANVIAAIL